jgi:hypothetical protein
MDDSDKFLEPAGVGAAGTGGLGGDAGGGTDNVGDEEAGERISGWTYQQSLSSALNSLSLSPSRMPPSSSSQPENMKVLVGNDTFIRHGDTVENSVVVNNMDEEGYARLSNEDSSNVWNQELTVPSLPEVYGSVSVAAGNAPWWKTMLSYVGPGAMVAVGYMDPGTVASMS